MKDLFEFNFDFLNIPIKIKVMTYSNKRDVVEYFDLEIWGGDAGFFVRKGEASIVFSETNYDKISDYSHEILHAVKHQLAKLGIDDEEIECYMLGYLLQIYTDFLEIHKKKIEELENDSIE